MSELDPKNRRTSQRESNRAGIAIVWRPIRDGAAAPHVRVDLSGVPRSRAPVSGLSRPTSGDHDAERTNERLRR